MKKLVTKKNLRLDVETIRSLEAKDLDQVAAGAIAGTKQVWVSCTQWICFIGW